ncbi:MAG: hypothetical protein M0R06_00420 [Sphaerochaeta sp.]|jgi:hypothetical protein|nr:hypothetical protein [Sphaerochaeta sp.]
MADGLQNFTTWTEVDPDSDIGVSSSTISKTDSATQGYVYYDFGGGYFTGDFAHQFVLNRLTWDGGDYGPQYQMVGIMWTDTIGSLATIMTSGGSATGIVYRKLSNSYSRRLYLFEIYNGILQYGEYVGTVYPSGYAYSRFIRTGTTITWDRYSDVTFSTITETKTLTLTGVESFRYVQVCGLGIAGVAATMQNFNEVAMNLIVNLEVPTVVTLKLTDLTSTTVTGNGYITDLGNPTATQHGFCWVDEITYDEGAHPPTVADSTTSEGVPSGLGTFSSSITGLTPLVSYRLRPYVTNLYGTGYGDIISIRCWPSSPSTRVGAIRFLYQPGTYRMETQLGGLTATVDYADIGVRKEAAEELITEAEAARDLAQRELEKAAIPTSSPIITGGSGVSTPSQVEAQLLSGLKTSARADTLRANPVVRTSYMTTSHTNALTRLSTNILNQNRRKSGILTEIQRLRMSLNARGITEYARQVLQNRIRQLRKEYDSIQVERIDER